MDKSVLILNQDDEVVFGSDCLTRLSIDCCPLYTASLLSNRFDSLISVPPIRQTEIDMTSGGGGDVWSRRSRRGEWRGFRVPYADFWGLRLGKSPFGSS